MQVLWLRFLTEVNEKTLQVPQELLAEPEIQKAVDVLEESGFTPAQLQGYDDFWDAVRVERTIRESAEERGYAEGMAKGEKAAKVKIAANLLSLGVPMKTIMQASGLSEEEIKNYCCPVKLLQAVFYI